MYVYNKRDKLMQDELLNFTVTRGFSQVVAYNLLPELITY